MTDELPQLAQAHRELFVAIDEDDLVVVPEQPPELGRHREPAESRSENESASHSRVIVSTRGLLPTVAGQALSDVMAPLRYRASSQRRPVLIAVVGADNMIDDDSAQPLVDDLERAIDAGATMLVVDLGRAAGLGTRGLNALLHARHRLLPRGGRVAMVLPPRLRRLFGLLGLDRRFVLAADRLQALELLGVTNTTRPGTRSPAPRARAA